MTININGWRGFTTTDFSDELPWDHEEFSQVGEAAKMLIQYEVSRVANQILAEKLAGAPEVRGRTSNSQWIQGDYQDINGKSVCTHTARLVNIEEVKK